MQKQAGVTTTVLLAGNSACNSACVHLCRQICHMHLAALLIRLSAHYVLLLSLAACLAWCSNNAVYSITLFLADVSVVAEGQVNYHNTKRLPYGGRDLDALLVSLLQQRGIQCSDPQKLKELCAGIPSAPSADPQVC